ncbi:MAG: glycosyltransferase family 4 protein [Alphaproteobacteria bacterium]
MKMCQAWGRQGHDVTLFGKGRMKNAFEAYGVEPCFSLSLAPNIKLPLISGAVRLLNLALSMMKMPKPDIVYGRDPVALALFTPRSIPVAFELHQMPYLLVHRVALHFLKKRKGFKGIFCISEALKGDFLKGSPKFPPEKLFVAHDGADLVQKKPVKAVLSGEAEAFSVGYVGSLHEGKGAGFILNIAEITPDINFHICGGSPAQVKALQAHAPQNVYFYGHISHGKLSEYVAVFDVVLAPYQRVARIKSGQDISRWVSPMKLFEYMAAEKAILCSDLPVIREVLTHTENAMLLSPDDAKAWRDAIRHLKNNPEISQALASQGFETLKKKYSWSMRAKNILESIA